MWSDVLIYFTVMFYDGVNTVWCAVENMEKIIRMVKLWKQKCYQCMILTWIWGFSQYRSTFSENYFNCPDMSGS